MSKFLIISNFGTKVLRWIFFALDTAIYYLSSVVYEVFHSLADATLLTDGVIKSFTTRIYAIIGVVMIFVIAFNLLNYIIDPDKINDKKTGAGTLVKDIVIALVLTTLMPTIFTKLYALQNQILTSNVLANLILGGYNDTSSQVYNEYSSNPGDSTSIADYYIRNGANNMVAQVFTAFFTPANSDFTTLDCIGSADDGKEELRTEYKEYCDAYDQIKATGKIQSFNQIYTQEKYDYKVVISTAAGIMLIFFMLSFCINLAKRVGKMAILQLLAPIPLAMEILPNKKGTREKWLNTLGSVYIEVFIYLAVIYLIIFLISLIPGAISGLIQAEGSSSSFVRVVATVILIFGLLQFGKEAPQMVMDLLGIKSTGVIKAALGRGVNMMGAAAAGFGVGATVGTRNAVNTVKSIKGAQGAGAKWKAAGSGILKTGSGMVSGVARGMYANRSGGFKGIGGRVNQATNQTLNNQGKFVNKVKDFASDVKNDGFGKTFFKPVTEWATGTTTSTSRDWLSSLSSTKDKFKPVSNVKDDTRYVGYQKRMTDLLHSEGIYDFEDKRDNWLKSNPGTTMRDYLMSAEFANDYPSGTHIANDLLNITDAMESREKAVKISKKEDLITQIELAKAYINSDQRYADLAKNNGIDFSSIHLDSNSTEADIINAYGTMAKFEKAIKSEWTNENRRLIGDQVPKPSNNESKK